MSDESESLTIVDTLGRNWTIITTRAVVGFQWWIYLYCGEVMPGDTLELLHPGGVANGWTDDDPGREWSLLVSMMVFKGATPIVNGRADDIEAASMVLECALKGGVDMSQGQALASLNRLVNFAKNPGDDSRWKVQASARPDPKTDGGLGWIALAQEVDGKKVRDMTDAERNAFVDDVNRRFNLPETERVDTWEMGLAHDLQCAGYDGQ